MDLTLIFAILGAIAATIAIIGAVFGVFRYLLGDRPPKPATAELHAETNRLLRQIRDTLANPQEGAADIGTDELAKAAGPDTAARLQEAIDLQAQHKEPEAIDALLEAFRRDLEPAAKAQLHGLLGNSFYNLSELEEAEGHYRQALDASRDAKITEYEAAALGNLGLIYRQQGELKQAEEHHQKALAISREINNRLSEAQDLGNLGIVYADLGDLDRSEEHHQHSLDIHCEIDDRLGEASQLGNLGNVYRRKADLDRAEEHYEQSLAINREIGNHIDEAKQLGNLGILAAQRDQQEDACRLLKEALTIFEEIGAEPDVAKARAALQKLGCE